MSIILKTVAFVTTGDEISDGDVLNTTGPAIARELVARGLQIKQHLMVPDNLAAITQAISDSLSHHDIVIITGGLGPTSDDLTRFALAKALGEELRFDETSWQQILDRFKNFNMLVGEHNRQQALFPSSAIVLPNPHGTANGCYVHYHNKFICMLPGPPHECLPMFETYVLPHMPECQLHKLHWLLMGISEGDIAAKLDAELKHLNCRTGYRADYPYLEFKVWADDAACLEECLKIVRPILQELLVSEKNIPASQQLRTQIENEKLTLKICDMATGGLLESTLLTPKTRTHLHFVTAEAADIIISGLTEYWQGKPAPHETEINLKFKGNAYSRKVMYRGNIVRQFVVEWVCWQILR